VADVEDAARRTEETTRVVASALRPAMCDGCARLRRGIDTNRPDALGDGICVDQNAKGSVETPGPKVRVPNVSS
jgi:hypothetical protein